MRGDGDFSLTRRFDGWDDRRVRFYFGYDAKPHLVELAGSLPESAWVPLRRRPRYEAGTDPREKRPNAKEAVVRANGYRNIRLVSEDVTDVEYRSTSRTRARGHTVS